MSITPALMPRIAAPTISKFVTPENARRRAVLETNFQKALAQRNTALDSKGFIRDAEAFRRADSRVEHFLDLIYVGIARGRWAK